MKTIVAALASAALLATPMASISTPAAAQPHGGGFHGRGGGLRGGDGGFHGGGFRGAGGFHGAGGFQGGDVHGDGFRGGHPRDRNDGTGLVVGLPFGDPYYYDDDLYGYYDGSDGYDVESYDDGAPACGSWAWDDPRGRYVWIPC